MTTSCRSRNHSLPPSEAGFALLLLVVVLIVISALLLDGALRARVEYRQASNAGAVVRARAAANAGLAHAIAHLNRQLRDHSGSAIPAGLATEALRGGALRSTFASAELPSGVRYEVSVHDVEARLNLNHASEEELRVLFLAVGADVRAADICAQSILDWRDEDGLHRGRGAEWDDWYRHQPIPVYPRNGPLESVEELRDVRGVAPFFDRVAPLVTIAGSGKVNLNTAPEEVLRAVPGLDPESVSLVLSRRSGAQPLRSPFEMEAALSPPARAHLVRRMADFLARAAFDSDEVEVVSRGMVPGFPFSCTIRAIAAGTGTEIQIVRTYEE